jgi:anti-anti-sigma factor
LFSITQIGGQVLTHIEPFSCTVTEEADHVVVAPRGELDMATVGAIETELRRLRGSGVDHLILDLGGLSFMDSSGLNLVSRWVEASSSDGFRFELEPGPPAVHRVFELAAMTDSLPFRTGPR